MILAVDIGTSSVRAAAFEADGRSFGLVQTAYGILRPEPFMEEQDPDAIRKAVHETIARCLGQRSVDIRRIAGMSFSSQMYSILPVDAGGRPLTNSIIWSDGRAEGEAAELRAEGCADAIYQSTGCPVNSIYPLSKLLWLRRHRADACAKATRFVSIKDYVLYPLIGEWVADHSLASGTGLFDVAAGTWSKTALDTVKIEPGLLSRIVPGDSPLPFANMALHREWGLADDVAVFVGGGDGPLANLGAGACGIGMANVDLGTSGAFRVASDRPVLDTAGRLWCYSIIPGRWAYGGILTNVGNAMQWLGTNIARFRTNVDRETAAAEISGMASEIEAGAEGVYFLPYLRKTRAPYWDDRMRGCVLGLTACHDIRHLARAALDAIAYDLADLVDIASQQVPLSAPIILTGGLSRIAIVPQLLADATGAAIEIPEQCEGSLAGAAIVGLRGAGLIGDYAFRRDCMPARKRFEPRPETASAVRRRRDDHRRLVELTRNLDLWTKEAEAQ